VPDHGKSQHENHSHIKTRLLDSHDSASNVTNAVFYSNRVTASGPITTSKQKHPGILWPNPQKQHHMLYTFDRKNRKVVCILLPEVEVCSDYFSISTIV